jgi:hypothetical protein
MHFDPSIHQELRQVTPSGLSGYLKSTRLELAKLSCLLAGSLDISAARAVIGRLADVDLSAAREAARALVSTVGYERALLVEVYEDLLARLQQQGASSAALSLDFAKALAAAFHLSTPLEGAPGASSSSGWSQVLERLLQLLQAWAPPPSDACCTDLRHLLRRLVAACLENGHQQLAYAPRLCDALVAILPPEDAEAVEQVR